MTISQAASVNLWREAILDRLAVLCMDAPQDEPPASILRRIIAAEVEIALDPSVSDAVPHRTLLQHLDALEPCVSEEGPEQHELDAARDSLAVLRAALAAPEPEPVAWYYVEDPWGANEWHFMTDSPESQECDPRDWTPLYAAPPAAPAPAAPVVPIDMVLHCPKCGLQHIDAPDERTHGWRNEPHRSHLCHGCGHIWRPADVPTNGVAAVATKGKADSPIAAPVVPLTDSELAKIAVEDEFLLYCDQDSFNEIARAIEATHGITGGKP